MYPSGGPGASPQPYPAYGGAPPAAPYTPGAPGAYPQPGAYPPPPQQQGQWPAPQQQASPPSYPYPVAGAAPDATQPLVQPQASSSAATGQQQQQAGASPPRGLLGFFSKGPSTSPGQTPSPGQEQASAERKGLFGLCRSNTTASPAAQAGVQSPEGQQQPLVPQQQHSGVTVVPPPSGLCSKAPPSLDEVAKLQASPLAPSKFEMLNKPPSVAATLTEAGPGAAAAAQAPAVDPNFAGTPPLGETFGPYLRFGGYNTTTRIYLASVMMVIHQTRSPQHPHLRYRDTHHRGSEMVIKNPELLWGYAGYNFWRWDLRVQLGRTPSCIEYAVVCSADHFFTAHTRYRFQLPAAGQKWHWGFYSCNGFHDPVHEVESGGIQPLWRDVMEVHARDPLHVMYGGGDQLYCDDVWKLPSLVQWLGIEDKPSRNMHPFSQSMVNETFDYYFRNYTTHFGKEVFADALTSIPQAMVWDDHDIFDGWGSYPKDLQECPVFAGVYFVARKFYLLFQQHASEGTYRQLNKGWGLTGLSWTHVMGSTAVIGLDSRGERTRENIIRPASWAAFQDQIAKLPSGVRHVVVMATVPLIYPTVPGVEEAMMALAGTGMVANAMTALLQKTGLASHIMSQFREPELLDDLLDHWSAKVHKEEKYCLIRMMQDLAVARGFRFTIISGDVHCAGAAYFQTMPKANLKTDPRYMMQVISSAIGNIPPPDAVIKALTASSKPKYIEPDHIFPKVTREKMKPIFENGVLLKAARNWCDVHERQLLVGPAAAAATMAGGVSGGPADGSLVFELHVENITLKGLRPRPQLYKIVVPTLDLPPGSYSPGPLTMPPPLPDLLMAKFQAELVAAGVGLEAALPLQAVDGQAPPGGVQVPATSTMAAMTSGATDTLANLGLHSQGAMQHQQQQPGEFGLQADVQQHQQQQPYPPQQQQQPYHPQQQQQPYAHQPPLQDQQVLQPQFSQQQVQQPYPQQPQPPVYPQQPQYPQQQPQQQQQQQYLQQQQVQYPQQPVQQPQQQQQYLQQQQPMQQQQVQYPQQPTQQQQQQPSQPQYPQQQGQQYPQQQGQQYPQQQGQQYPQQQGQQHPQQQGQQYPQQQEQQYPQQQGQQYPQQQGQQYPQQQGQQYPQPQSLPQQYSQQQPLQQQQQPQQQAAPWNSQQYPAMAPSSVPPGPSPLPAPPPAPLQPLQQPYPYGGGPPYGYGDPGQQGQPAGAQAGPQYPLAGAQPLQPQPLQQHTPMAAPLQQQPMPYPPPAAAQPYPPPAGYLPPAGAPPPGPYGNYPGF